MRAIAALLCVLALPTAALAQSGVLLASATAPEGARRIVALRAGDVTVVTLDGLEASEALVIPLPGPLEPGDVRIIARETLDRLDGMTAPELLGYVERDPCLPDRGSPGVSSHAAGTGTGEAGRDEPPPVRVAGTFEEGDVDLEVLAATDVSALETWIAAHHAGVHEGAAAQLRAHLELARTAGREGYFLVTSVDREAGAPMPPIRLVIRSPQLSVPLGLFSPGMHDVVVITLARFTRQAVATSADVMAPTGLEVTANGALDFPALHAAVLGRLSASHPGELFTETARAASTCMNCRDAVDEAMLATLGADVLFPAGFARRGIDPSVALRDFGVRSGSLGADQARRVLRRHQSQAAYCFEQTLVRFPSLGGDVDVRFSGSSEGRVTSVELAHDGWAPPVLTECLRRAVGGWTFPETAEGFAIEASYRFGRSDPAGTTRIDDWVVSRLRGRLDGERAPLELVMAPGAPVSRAGQTGAAPFDAFHVEYEVRRRADEPRCAEPDRYRWEPATDRAAAGVPDPSPGSLEAPLAELVAPPPALAPPAPAIVAPAPSAAAPPAPPARCACRAGRSDLSPLGALLVGALLPWLNRRRRFG